MVLNETPEGYSFHGNPMPTRMTGLPEVRVPHLLVRFLERRTCKPTDPGGKLDQYHHSRTVHPSFRPETNDMRKNFK